MPYTLQGGSEAEEVSALKNQLAEVEEEKGSLQLKLVNFDDLKVLQGKEDQQMIQHIIGPGLPPTKTGRL